MTATNKIRVATADRAGAINLVRAEVESATGMAVEAEFQEIEGDCLILELRVGDESTHSAHPTRLGIAVDNAAPAVQVLSAWNEPAAADPFPQLCNRVLGVQFDTMPAVAHRALIDRLPTAQWDRSDACWHLAVPSVFATRPLVGVSHRRGYTHRFTSFEAAAIRCGLAS
ncbi:MAG TPA: hypothetical protein VGG43_06540 [Acidimicrobiales bacterium]|jgi:hypothetical protein